METVSNGSIELSEIDSKTGYHSMMQKKVDFHFMKPEKEHSLAEFTFSTKDLDDDSDEVEEEGICAFFFSQLKEFFVENIPIQTFKDLPGFCK